MENRFENPLPNIPLHSQGKVRDMYDLGEYFLMVATDRISAFDVVLPCLIPGKGKILNQLSLFWFHQIGIPNHLVTANVDEYPKVLQEYRDYLRGRSMIVRKANRFDVECIARGYLVGSGWKDYQKSGSVCGRTLPPEMKMCGKLDPPIFTPSTKAENGHDQNISFRETQKIVGPYVAEELCNLTLEIYSRARKFALSKGIIIADTKVEFGEVNGEIIVIDELLTPDSSRFWPLDTYREGFQQESFDKQIIRDWLETKEWDKCSPGPAIPEDVIQKTLEKYCEIFRRLTGYEPEI